MSKFSFFPSPLPLAKYLIDSWLSFKLDLVFVNEDTLISDIEHLAPVAKSDHQALFFTLYVSEVSKLADSDYKYDLSKGNYDYSYTVRP